MELSLSRITPEQTIEVRHRVLWPDKDPSYCVVEGDNEAWHFGALVEQQLVAVASLFINGNQARLRKFATLDELQGKGIGTRLMQFMIQHLHDNNIEMLWCDARQSASGFYQRFGLTVEGKSFLKNGRPHVRMTLTVSKKP